MLRAPCSPPKIGYGKLEVEDQHGVAKYHYFCIENIFFEFFKTKSDQNIHQHAPNCTTIIGVVRGEAKGALPRPLKLVKV